MMTSLLLGMLVFQLWLEVDGVDMRCYHKYWRLTVTTLSSSGWETYFYTLNLIDPFNTNINNQMTVSSNRQFAVANAFDSDTTTSSTFPGSGLPVVGDYIQFFCSSQCLIDSVYMHQYTPNPLNRIPGWKVQYSDTGTVFYDKWSFSAANEFTTSVAPTTNCSYRTSSPTAIPTISPTRRPTTEPTFRPSAMPTFLPTAIPTAVPTFLPSAIPSLSPTATPTTIAPSFAPTAMPSLAPTIAPTTISPTTSVPSFEPTAIPSFSPTYPITSSPTFSPTARPTTLPTANPSASPTFGPKYECAYHHWRLSVKALSSSGLETYITDVNLFDGSTLLNRNFARILSNVPLIMNNIFDQDSATKARFPRTGLPEEGDYIQFYCVPRCIINKVYIEQTLGETSVPKWSIQRSVDGVNWQEKWVITTITSPVVSIAPANYAFENCTFPSIPLVGVPALAPTASPTPEPTTKLPVNAQSNSGSSSEKSSSTVIIAVSVVVSLVAVLAFWWSLFYYRNRYVDTNSAPTPTEATAVEVNAVMAPRSVIHQAQVVPEMQEVLPFDHDLESPFPYDKIIDKPPSNHRLSGGAAPPTNNHSKAINKLKYYHCFLSHNWGVDADGRDNHKRVAQINDSLKKYFDTWFDSDRMRGDVLTEMVGGIDRSKCVIIFITKKYMDKINGPDGRDNCKVEYELAFRRKGPHKIIPVVMEDCMLNNNRWDGLLALLQGRLYIDCSNGFDAENEVWFENAMELLATQIETAMDDDDEDKDGVHGHRGSHHRAPSHRISHHSLQTVDENP